MTTEIICWISVTKWSWQ
uniref:Uncharacterized protein n=1 Tax=Anguilla anguilla TaxID=7936 RepID=A0A0E9TTJ6_ANGAN